MLSWLGTMGSRAGKVFRLRCCLIYAACLWGVSWRSFSSLAPESRQPPKWWQQGWARQRAGSVAEAELLAPLGELLMPSIPLEEMFRSFKSPAGWRGHYLEPDLTACGVLKDQRAALFLEYDGYWRHGERECISRDEMKNVAMLSFAPPGSYVVRINHENRCQMKDNVLWVSVSTWRLGDGRSFTRTFKTVVEQILQRLQHALNPGARKRFEAHLSNERLFVISRSAQEYCEAASVQGRGNTTEEIWNFLNAKGFGHADIDQMQEQVVASGLSIEKTLQPLLQWLSDFGLTQGQVAKALYTFPPILGCSIEQNLKPTVQWFLDFGLTKKQVAKAVVTCPQILGCSIEQNLKPTVQWFLESGLTKRQVVRAVVTSPAILGYSIEQNLKPTVQWFLDFGLAKEQVVKAVVTSPAILGYSIEQNLKPSVQWFLDLGLTKAQVVRAVVTFPQILGYSIEQNLKPTVQWFLDLGLTKAQVVRAVVTCPQILGCSIEQNLKPTVQWFLELGLTKRQVAKAVACFPQILGLSIDNLACKVTVLQSCLTVRETTELIAQWPVILGYSRHRLEYRLHLLSEQGRTEKLMSAMSLTEEAFQKRFLASQRRDALCCLPTISQSLVTTSQLSR